jgi:arylsulfatase A-like enzyme
LIRRVIKSPTAVGIISGISVFLLFFFLTLVLNPEYSYFDIKVDRIKEYAFEHFKTLLITYHILIVAVSCLLGGLIGGICGFLLSSLFYFADFKKKIQNKNSVGILKKLLCILPLILFFHLLFLAHGIVKYPQLYSSSFYSKGGFLAFIQTFLTDNVPLWLISTIIILFVILAVLAGLARLFIFIRQKKSVRFAVLLTSGLVILPGLLLSAGMMNVGNFRHRSPENLPNILIIGIDSLRPDEIDEKHTPEIFSMLKDSIFFKNAIVPLARTFPSWVSFLTSTNPNVHGIRNMFPRNEDLNITVPKSPEILKNHGYRTAVISDYAGDIFSRIDLGFEEKRTPYFNFDAILKQRSLERQVMLLPYLTNRIGRFVFPVLNEFAQNADPEYIVSEFRDFLSDVPDDVPFFTVIFISAPHFPYAAPYPLYKKFMNQDYQGPFRYYKPPVDRKEGASAADIDQVKALYSGACAAADNAAGKIAGLLEKAGIENNTIVVITADHGENLYDTGLKMGHGDNLKGRFSYTIPMIMRIPQNAGKGFEYKNLVRSIDLMPTIFDMLNIPRPEKWQGVSLLPIIKGSSSENVLEGFMETGLWFYKIPGEPYADIRVDYPDLAEILEIDGKNNNEVVIKEKYKIITNLAKQRAFVTDRWKLLYLPTKEGNILYELYDIKNDPLETDNLVDKKQEIFESMKKKLFERMLDEKGVILQNEILIPE